MLAPGEDMLARRTSLIATPLRILIPHRALRSPPASNHPYLHHHPPNLTMTGVGHPMHFTPLLLIARRCWPHHAQGYAGEVPGDYCHLVRSPRCPQP